MSTISHISTEVLVHDYLESYMDLARCELALLYPDGDGGINYKIGDTNHEKLTDSLEANKTIVRVIVNELRNREDTSLFDRRELVLGAFSV